MGKYTNQASSYKMGMNSLQTSLENIGLEIEKVRGMIENEDNKDALNYYVNSFNEGVKDVIEGLNLKCTSIPFSVMQKAAEIDKRIELEQLALNTEEKDELNDSLEQENVISDNTLRKEHDTILRTDISSKMGW